MKNSIDTSKKRIIKIYIDSGVNIKFLKNYYEHCEFVTFPYDSSHRRKTSPKPSIATPSAAQWRDCHIPWSEVKFPWGEFAGSPIYKELEQIIGKSNRQDILHLDSAHKDGVDIFLTSDKDDIWNHRERIEKITLYKIFHPSSEEESIISYIKNLIQNQITDNPANC